MPSGPSGAVSARTGRCYCPFQCPCRCCSRSRCPTPFSHLPTRPGPFHDPALLSRQLDGHRRHCPGSC
eukprot:78558-Rhodomonas_salina.1